MCIIVVWVIDTTECFWPGYGLRGYLPTLSRITWTEEK